MGKRKQNLLVAFVGLIVAFSCFCGAIGIFGGLGIFGGRRAYAASEVDVNDATAYTDCIDADAAFDKNGLTVTQQSDKIDIAADAYNDTIRMTWNKPIYLGDNTTDDSELITLKLHNKASSTVDINVVIITVEDWDDPTQYFSVALMNYNLQAGKALVRARAAGQSYAGYYHDNKTTKKYANDMSLGDVAPQVLFSFKGNSELTFFYNNDTQRLFVNNIDTTSGYKFVNANGNDISTANEKYLIRDFNGYGWDTSAEKVDTASSAWNKSLQKARISIEAVRRIKIDKGAYESDGGYRDPKEQRLMAANSGDAANSLDYNTTRWKRDGVCSDKGAHFSITSLDGQSLIANNGSITDNEPIYGVSSTASSKAIIPAVEYGGIFGQTFHTSSLYVKVKDPSNGDVAVSGLRDGKWQEGCYFSPKTDGVYTVEYSETQNGAVQATCKITVSLPDFDNMETVDATNTFEYANNNGIVTSAAANGMVTVGDSAPYSGVSLHANESGAAATFSKTVPVSDLTKDKALFEFMYLPKTQGVAGNEVIEIIVADANDETNALTIVAKKSWGPENLTAILAAGKGQNFYGNRAIRAGEYWGSYSDGVEARRKAADYGMIVAPSPSGVGHGGYCDNPTQAKNAVIGLYYDNATKKLYATPDMVYSGYTGEKGLVRDFGLTELPGQNSNKYIQTAWNGFTGGEVKITVKINQESGAPTTGILVTKVGGVELGERVYSDPVPAYGVVNHVTPIPLAMVLTGGDPDEFFDVGSVQIKAPDGTTTEIVAEPHFTPTQAGEYTLTYGVKIGDKTYGTTTKITVLSKDVADSDYPIVINHSPELNPDAGSEVKTSVRNAAVNISASAQTGLQLTDNKCDISLTIQKRGASARNASFTADQLGPNATYQFTEVGVYDLVYTATDIVGRTASKTCVVEIIRTDVKRNGDSSVPQIYELGEKIEVSATDIKAFDLNDMSRTELTAENTTQLDTKIEYRKGEKGNFVAYDSNAALGSQLGDYYVRYTVSYKMKGDDTLYSGSLTWKFEVRDTVYPVFGDETVVAGNVFNDTTQQSTADAVYLRARTGAQITVTKPSATDVRKEFDDVNLDDAVKVLFNKEGNDPAEISFDGDTHNITLDEIGKYYITVTVSDEEGNETHKVYTIAVKDNWLTFGTLPEFGEREVKSAITLTKPSVSDNDSPSDAPISVKVFYKSGSGDVELTVAGDEFVLPYVGEYEIEYSATANGEVVTARTTVIAKDSTKPTVDVSDIATSGNIGERFEFAIPSATDNYDSALEVKVSLKFGEETTELASPHFTPEKEGEYTLVFTCTDSAGNITTEQVTITVKSVAPVKKNHTLAIVLGVVGGVVLLGGAAVLSVFLIRKKKAGISTEKNDDEKDN